MYYGSSDNIFSILWLIFTFFSPFIAIIAIVQWASAASKKRANGGLDEYHRGYRDGYGAGASSDVTTVASTRPVPALQLNDGFVDASSASMYTQLVVGEVEDETPFQQDQYAPGPMLIQPELTPEEKSKRTLNMLLSLSSLLFVAAGIAFIASGFSDGVKLLGILGIVTVFYGGGLALHYFSETLRPAAVAFIGTGLALIPFLGVAFSAYTTLSPEIAWLLTSIIGVIAYFSAAVYLQNQVVSYLTVGFALSLVSSMVATAALPLMWYFVAMIVISLIASIVAYVRPKWMPELFRAPVEQTGNFVTPTALAGSLLAGQWLELYHYEIIFSLTTLQYFVAMLQQKSYAFEQVVRMLTHITVLIFAYDYADSFSGFGTVFVAMLIVQQLCSIVRARYVRHWVDENVESAWLWVCFALYLITPIFWSGSSEIALMNTLVLGIVLTISGLAVSTLRNSGYGYPGLVALLLLPTYVGLELLQPQAPAWGVTATYELLAACCMFSYYFVARQRSAGAQALAIIASVVLTAVASLWLLAVPSSGAGIVLSVGLIGLYVVLSYVKNAAHSTVFIAIPVVFLGYRVATLLELTYGEAGFVLAGVGVSLSYALAGGFTLLKSRTRRNIMIALGQLFIVPFAFSSLLPFTSISPESARIAAVLVLLIWLLGSWVCRWISRDDSPRLHVLFTASYIVYYVLALALSTALPAGWFVGLLGLGVVLVWELAHSEDLPSLAYLANGMTVWFFYELFILLQIDPTWLLLIVSSTSVALFYGLRWAFVRSLSSGYQQAMLYSAWSMIAFGFISSQLSADVQVVVIGASLLLVGATTVWFEGYLKREKIYYEVALYMATVAVSVLLAKTAPTLDSLVYVHLWALAFGIAGYLHHSVTRYALAMGLITFFVGLRALGEGGTFALLFLIEHVTLAVVGAVTGKTWATRWGVIASVLAVFYYLKDIPFLAFTLLGVVVVSFVIWRLKRQKSA